MYQVLIVDDDKLSRSGLIAITDWESCNLKVVGDVSNGRQALTFLETQHVDLAIVDLSMPVMSGLDFIRESKGLYPDLQYVVLSFHEEFEYVQNALRLGALDYISKLRIEEDCTQAFRKISVLLEQKLSGAKEALDLDTEAYNQLVHEWLNLNWLFSTYLYRVRLAALRESNLSLRQMERMVLMLVNEINKVFAVSYELPFLKDITDGISEIETIHNTLTRMVFRSPDFSIMSNAMLAAAIYTQFHLAERPKEEMVAQFVGLSRSYFASNFSNATGYTFSEFMRMERIEKARTLMLVSRTSPEDAAEAVGYTDFKYFCSIYQKVTGESCLQFFKQLPSLESDC